MQAFTVCDMCAVIARVDMLFGHTVRADSTLRSSGCAQKAARADQLRTLKLEREQ
jgi:hypothetical protein